MSSMAVYCTMIVYTAGLHNAVHFSKYDDVMCMHACQAHDLGA
jgi:hypothetical protein